ncbi:MAG: CRISPR DNA repeat-binding protein Cbp1 [Sulfolobus sp.]|jgi:transposase-like protein
MVDVELLKELYQKGYSIRKIAREVGMSYGKVRNLLIKAGVELRRRTVDEQKVLELARQGYSARAISRTLNVSESSVLRILRKHKMGKRIKKLGEKDIELIKELYESGESIYGIAKRLRKSTNLIVYHLKKLGLYKTTRGSSSTSL